MNQNNTFKIDHNSQNLYEILGIDTNASQCTIKEAFKKLAIKKHPDKGGNTKEFSNIQLAYNTLKNEDTRKIYDDNLKAKDNDNDVVCKDKNNYNAHIIIYVDYSWNDINLKKPLLITYTRMVVCSTCKGLGSLLTVVPNSNYSDVEPCIVCKGQGRLFNFRRAHSKWLPCFHCYGAGAIETINCVRTQYVSQENCASCDGSGTVSQEEYISISPHEYINQELNGRLTLMGKGNAFDSICGGGLYGNLIIIVKEIKTSNDSWNTEDLSRTRFDLNIAKYITFYDCITGGDLTFSHPFSSQMKTINIPPMIDENGIFDYKRTNFTLQESGFGGLGKTNIYFKVVCPETCDALQKLCGSSL